MIILITLQLFTNNAFSLNFIQLNQEISAFQLPYVKEIRRIDSLERQLRLFLAHIRKQKIPISEPNDLTAVTMSNTSDIDYLIDKANTWETSLQEMSKSAQSLNARRNSLIEKRCALIASSKFFDKGNSSHSDIRISLENQRNSLDNDHAPLLDDLEGGYHDDEEESSLPPGFAALNVRFISGVITRQKSPILERILWRALRGNLFINFVPIEEKLEDPRTGEQVYMNVFVAFAHGDYLLKKMKRICESLDTTLYDIDHSMQRRRDDINETNAKIQELDSVIHNTNIHLASELRVISEHLGSWFVVARKERLIYESLNKFGSDSNRHLLVVEGWIPTDDIPRVKNAIQTISLQAGLESTFINIIKTNRVPPTFFRTNKFTGAFQSIVDAYGIASYKEVNPGLATIVTFPFMFAIMFGDVGHGIILSLAALVFVWKEKFFKAQKLDEITEMAFSGRYILLLMGVFSIYTGAMYNDIFSRSMTIFKSHWKWPGHAENEAAIATSIPGTYPFGLDYAWHGTENGLIFTNSYKMKMSILIGFVHMLYSLCFSLVNYRHKKSRVDIIGNFIPSIIFMVSIFGYLAVCVVYKWTVDWNAIEKPPPGLLNMLINMFLSPGKIEAQLYPGQAFVQKVLVLLAVACVPWLLLVKPLWLRRIHSNQAISKGYQNLGRHSEEIADNLLDEFEEESAGALQMQIEETVEKQEEFEFGEVMIHQVIHTIEFCLNCVSHTASYLRLWALSLAHSQLSSVLWEMTFKPTFGASQGFWGTLFVFLGFFFWFVLTVCILVLMEGISAMLHSLRLHWVEAMSKFFEGEGHKYDPFSFENCKFDLDEAVENFDV